MSAASPMTAQTIIEKLCRDHVHRPQAEGSPAGVGTAGQLGRSRVVLRRAWGVFNKWALEILRERGTIDVPNFVRVGWQRFRRLDGQVRFTYVELQAGSDNQQRAKLIVPHSAETHVCMFKRMLLASNM